MNDRPTSVELLAAIRGFLEKELLPTLSDPRLKFQTLIAVNVLGICEREILSEETSLRKEWRWLNDLLDEERSEPPPLLADLRQAVREHNERICNQIRQGAYDHPADSARLTKILRAQVEEKLRLANPRYLQNVSRVLP